MIAKVPRGPMLARQPVKTCSNANEWTNPDKNAFWSKSDRQCSSPKKIYGFREQLLAAVKLQQSALFIKGDLHRL